jgi:4-amino-4-deoxy-L-arabinose transferase-like glycosyltransferase
MSSAFVRMDSCGVKCTCLMKAHSLPRMAGTRFAHAAVPVSLAALIGFALLLRTWSLDKIPPWLWWDEASQGLDARDLLNGHFQVFFPRAQGKEPLYVYLTTPFVAASDGEAVAVRLAGALSGVLMVPALYAAGRALWRERPVAGVLAGLAAAGFWVTNLWPQMMNRIGFQVNAFPLILTLAVVTWLNWTHRPTRRRALVFGVLAGLTLATYLAARITPFLWLLLYLALPRHRRRALRSTLPWAVLAFGLVLAPLAVHFVLHPDQALERVSMFATFYQAPSLHDKAYLLADSAVQVAGGFLGWAGDPILRHNIPNRSPFSPALAALFAAGLGFALFSLSRREQRGWTLSVWLAVLCFPAWLSANSNPHFPRLFGALPAALLLAAWPVAWVTDRLSRVEALDKVTLTTLNVGTLRSTQGRLLARWLGVALLILLLVNEGARTAYAYFVTWAKPAALYTAFQGDLWTFAEQVKAAPGTIGLVPVDPSSGQIFDYAYQNVPIAHVQVDGTTIENWLDERLKGAGGRRVVTPIWQVEPYVYADPQELLPFYLTREGTLQSAEEYPGYTRLTFSLGATPQFETAGQQAALRQSFGPNLTLVGARWGAAYPNSDRGSDTAAAGTAFWAILTWRIEHPQADPRSGVSSLKVAADLVDEAGHRLASAEGPLLDKHVSALSPDGIVRTYHLVTVPATQPPGPVSLETRAYHADTLVPVLPREATARGSARLAAAAVGPALRPVEPDDVHPERPLRANMASGLTLLGTDGWPETLFAGDSLSLRLYWLAEGGSLRSGRSLALSLTGTAVSTTVTLPGDTPPSAEGIPPPAGQVFHTFADLRLPADLSPGSYALALASTPGPTAVKLGNVSVAARDRQFEPPMLAYPLAASFGEVQDPQRRVVASLGLASAPSVLEAMPGQVVTVTLVWRALETPQAELVRFVHVLGGDGHPVAQRDSAPCEGTCPATSWLPGQVLLDPVQIEIPSTLSPGNYPLATGWYDYATQTRLPVYDTTGQQLPGDLLILPVSVTVIPSGSSSQPPLGTQNSEGSLYQVPPG